MHLSGIFKISSLMRNECSPSPVVVQEETPMDLSKTRI